MQLTIEMLVILGVCTMMDCLYRRIWMPFVIAGISVIVICFCVTGEMFLGNIVCGLTVSGLFYGISIVTEGQIGKADSVILGLLSFVLGFQDSITFLFLCFFYAFAAALILMIVFRKNRHTRIPFVPFMLLGYITILVF